jgi:hypothetical protein
MPAQVSRQFAKSRAAHLRHGGKQSLLHRSLLQAFNARSGMRRVLRHLAHFESALAAMGDEALAVLPVGVLGKAYRQLDILLRISAPSHELALLSKRMEQVLARRTGTLPTRHDKADPLDASVGVSDASLDEYDAAVADSDVAALDAH